MSPTSLSAGPSARRLLVALAAAGLVGLPAAAAAQDRDDGALAVAAATVKGAATQALNTAQGLSSFALELLGIRYKWGGNTPSTGLDCSGLVRYVFQKVTGVTLPRTAKEMSRLGEQVSVPELQPGDLVFFDTRRFAFSHVGIYLGDNRFVHAPRQGREVEVATLDSSFWQKRFNGARRMIGVLPDLMPRIVSEAAAAPFEAVTNPGSRLSGTLWPVPAATPAPESTPSAPADDAQP
ncbi:MAG TPA: C40 family peptidase [Casimicrobiaceae bacterium]|nr:C40 family peptidase [Casimicrobiaceae bacterium]